MVFTGGHSLYEAKKHSHSNIYPFPSSIDKNILKKQGYVYWNRLTSLYIPHPRIGFFGVIDERLDIDLLEEWRCIKPDWHFVIIGPVVKIDPSTLPVMPIFITWAVNPMKNCPPIWPAGMLR